MDMVIPAGSCPIPNGTGMYSGAMCIAISCDPGFMNMGMFCMPPMPPMP